MAGGRRRRRSDAGTITPTKPNLDHANPAEWRASASPNGSPGTIVGGGGGYSEWAAGYPGIGGPNADDDRDGYNNRLEYALAGNPLSSVPNRAPVGGFTQVAGQTYATLTYVRRANAPDVVYAVQFAGELLTWNIPAVLVSSTPNGDGTLTEVWRSAQSVSARSRVFGRVVVSEA
jgi:hypothetical protein